MAVLRKFARPMLASTFVSGGFATLRRTAAATPGTGPVALPDGGPVALPLAERIRRLADDPEQLAAITGSVQVAAGTLLALGRFPRSCSLALAAALVPAAFAGQPYWTVEDPGERSRRRDDFFTNLSLAGGLLLAAADTHGKPSLAHRARHGARHATTATGRRVHDAGDSLHSAADTLTHGVEELTGSVRDHLPVG